MLPYLNNEQLMHLRDAMAETLEGATITYDAVSYTHLDVYKRQIHDRVPVQKVEPMTDRDYSVRGCTALLDAIGGAIPVSYTHLDVYKRQPHT